MSLRPLFSLGGVTLVKASIKVREIDFISQITKLYLNDTLNYLIFKTTNKNREFEQNFNASVSIDLLLVLFFTDFHASNCSSCPVRENFLLLGKILAELIFFNGSCPFCRIKKKSFFKNDTDSSAVKFLSFINCFLESKILIEYTIL